MHRPVLLPNNDVPLRTYTGTGFDKDYSIFDDTTRQQLNVETDGLYLFRHTVPTKVDNLAFVGSEIATISNIGTYGIQAAWLGKLWRGEMPAVDDRVCLKGFPGGSNPHRNSFVFVPDTTWCSGEIIAPSSPHRLPAEAGWSLPAACA